MRLSTKKHKKLDAYALGCEARLVILPYENSCLAGVRKVAQQKL